MPPARRLTVCKLREIICFTGAAVVTEVEVLVEEIIAVMIERLVNKSENASGAVHQLKFCKVKEHKEFCDSIEALYQSKVINSLHSDVNDKEEVCYFLKSRFPMVRRL